MYVQVCKFAINDCHHSLCQLIRTSTQHRSGP